MLQIKNASPLLAEALRHACEMADARRDEFFTPEHLLWGLTLQTQFMAAAGDCADITKRLMLHIQHYVPRVPEAVGYDGATPSELFVAVVGAAHTAARMAEVRRIDVPHVVRAMLASDDSLAGEVLRELCHGDAGVLLGGLIGAYAPATGRDAAPAAAPASPQGDTGAAHAADQSKAVFLTCLNDTLDTRNPLIGREAELARTVEVLCRKDKNNPLHVGEAGVGKTALAYGLARLLQGGDVPERLRGAKVFALDFGALMAGAQYRGEMEKRLKDTLDTVEKTHGGILYIDDIHLLVGAGRTEGGALDAAAMLRPYLERGTLRFMGATTYEEYNRAFAKNKAFARRFEKIDIAEPTAAECALILRGLRAGYEAFHHVRYTDAALDYAATAADKHLTGRFLPDKAIDLIDEAGAWREIHPQADAEQQTVDEKLVREVLAKMTGASTLAEPDDKTALRGLEDGIKRLIYGQDEAVREVVEAVQLASAGLTDDNKPMASLLFVGPTGVGKTEVARVLAQQLAVPLVRFDMSEYAEKHTVAKLIGAPAGYVGYDDGGLLTDAIRKTPHCVLLFDELEKAHADIYNILLQVMDYAVLTDSRGQKADFRHVVFIMTTNAGAAAASEGGAGFVRTTTAGEAMMKSVRLTFKPEFLNRLTAINIFHDMTRDMASRILAKKLDALREKLAQKKVSLRLTAAATEHLLAEGFSPKYGGREIDRVISAGLKPLLMRELLFGRLSAGGEAVVDVAEGKLAVAVAGAEG